jgi:hypothetical protein
MIIVTLLSDNPDSRPGSHHRLARQLRGMSILDAGPGAGLEESLKTLVPKTLDHLNNRIAMLYEHAMGVLRYPSSKTLKHLDTHFAAKHLDTRQNT